MEMKKSRQKIIHKENEYVYVALKIKKIKDKKGRGCLLAKTHHVSLYSSFYCGHQIFTLQYIFHIILSNFGYN